MCAAMKEGTFRGALDFLEGITAQTSRLRRHLRLQLDVAAEVSTGTATGAALLSKNGVFTWLCDSNFDHIAGRNRDLLASGGIAADLGFSVDDLHDRDAGKREFLVLLRLGVSELGELIQHQTDIFLCKSGVFCESIDNLNFREWLSSRWHIFSPVPRDCGA